MYELIKNPNYNWLGLKRPFIGISVALLAAGLLSVTFQGFNLGVDFAGGTLVSVKFKGARPTDDQIRNALGRQGIDTGKVVLQPVKDPLGGNENQLLIRFPIREAASVGQTPAQSPGNDAGATPQQATGPAQTEAPPTSAPTGEVQSQPPVEESQAGEPGGVRTEAPTQEDGGLLGQDKRAILATLESLQDPALAANKTDLNTAGRERLRNELLESDPLGLVAASGQAGATSEYGRYADLIVNYRDREAGGLVNGIPDLKNVPGLPSRLVETLPENFFAGTAVMTSAEIVGPQIGEELRERAIYVTLASFVGILIYMAFRFEWIYGVAAVVAVCHDLLVTLGVFSILQEEISLNVVAALLTLAGYSVNDTIVIFDRVRENIKLRRRDDLELLVNDSINQTLSRTILVSGLTFLAVFMLLMFGGPVLRGLALALTIGIIVGSYSTLAIASPIMVWWQRRQEEKLRGRRRQDLRKRQAKQKMAAG